MARYNDGSCHPDRWTNAKLIREARKYADMENLSIGYNHMPVNFKEGWHDQVQDKDDPRIEEWIRDQTRLYRQSWLHPILDEIEKRFVKK